MFVCLVGWFAGWLFAWSLAFQFVCVFAGPVGRLVGSWDLLYLQMSGPVFVEEAADCVFCCWCD